MSSLTVVMPVYNGEKYISEQLDSILWQLLPGDELIVCDDCSSDSSLKILADYSNKFPCIRLLKNDSNMGVNFTVFKLLQKVVTDRFCFVDQDDIWLEGRLNLIRNSAECLVIVPYFINVVSDDFSKKGSLNVMLSLFKNTIPGCSIGGTTLIVRNIYTSPNFITLYDHYIVAKAFLSGIEFVFDSVPRFVYRRHECTLTKTGWAAFGFGNALKNRIILFKDLFFP